MSFGIGLKIFQLMLYKNLFIILNRKINLKEKYLKYLLGNKKIEHHT